MTATQDFEKENCRKLNASRERYNQRKRSRWGWGNKGGREGAFSTDSENNFILKVSLADFCLTKWGQGWNLSSWILVRFVTPEPQRELPGVFCKFLLINLLQFVGTIAWLFYRNIFVMSVYDDKVYIWNIYMTFPTLKILIVYYTVNVFSITVFLCFEIVKKRNLNLDVLFFPQIYFPYYTTLPSTL